MTARTVARTDASDSRPEAGVRRLHAAILIGLASSGLVCATATRNVQQLPDGSYRLGCNGPLASCLATLGTICNWHGYDVVSGDERRGHPDLRDVPDDTVTSEAVLRCRPGEPLLGSWPSSGAAPSAGKREPGDGAQDGGDDRQRQRGPDAGRE